MDDHGWRDILSRHQENAGAVSILSLLWAMAYAVIKRLDLWAALAAAGIGALAGATLWIFLAEFINPNLIIMLPVAVGCGVGAFPLMRSWTKKDDAITDGVVDTAGGFITKWLKRFGGGA